MKKGEISGFLLSFAKNLLRNFWGTVFAIVMLVMHLTLGVPIWFFGAALSGWIVIIAIYTVLTGRLNDRFAQKTESPYPKSGYTPINTHR